MNNEIRDKNEGEVPNSGGATMVSQEAPRRKFVRPSLRNNGCTVARTISGDLYYDEYGNPIGHIL